MDAEFEKLRQEVESDLGRPLEQSEEIELKALYYFGKGVKLKNQLESKPQHISEILPAVMTDIRGRMERQRKSQHKRRVISAVQDFMGSTSSRMKKRSSKERRYFRADG